MIQLSSLHCSTPFWWYNEVGSCRPGGQRPPVDRVRSGEVLRTSRMCHRESGRVLTADIVECATRMRINMKRNHPVSLNGMGFSWFLPCFVITYLITWWRVEGVCALWWMLSLRESSTSQQDQNKTYLQAQQDLKRRVRWFVFMRGLFCILAGRSVHPAAPCSSLNEWADTMTQYLLLSKYNYNIIGPCSHK